MGPRDRFSTSMRSVSVTALALAAGHLVVPWIVYGGTDPMIPVQNAYALWDVQNSGFALGLLFAWAGPQAWVAASSYDNRGAQTLVTVLGLGLFFAVDTLYLLIRPMPTLVGPGWIGPIVTGVLGLNALACANAAYVLLSNPRDPAARSG